MIEMFHAKIWRKFFVLENIFIIRIVKLCREQRRLSGIVRATKADAAKKEKCMGVLFGLFGIFILLCLIKICLIKVQ